MTHQQLYKIIETIVLALLTCCAVALGMTSCKVWRTVSTTSSYSVRNDSTKNETVIKTTTLEEYQGVRRK